MFFPLHPGWLQDCSDALAALTDLIPQLSSASEGSRRSLLCHAQVCILKDEAELIRAPKKPVGRGYSNHLGETGSHKKDPQWRLYLGVAQRENTLLQHQQDFHVKTQGWSCPGVRSAATCLLQVPTLTGEHEHPQTLSPDCRSRGVVDLWHSS